MYAKKRGPSSLTRIVRTSFLGITLCLFIVLPVQSLAQGNTSYIYDQLGRLVGVVDPSSQTAKYVYDGTGNILSVSRYSSKQISIIQFSPNNGPTSTTVEIYGTGFSATASQDTVAFNGTPATITSASVTSIITTVPAGATTGTITVTSPAGSVTSKQSFTVGVPNTPTVTTFTPTIGTPGTAVTVDGTNFQTTGGNTLRFNLAPSRVGTTTASTIKTNVPVAATSGHISVTTPFGTGTSTADFFAPPAPYTVRQVAFTGRTSTGQTSTMTIGTAGDIGLMVFDETSDHRVSLVASNVTIALCGSLSMLSPTGVTLVPNTDICNGSPSFLDSPTLTTSGTYTILASTTTAGGAGNVTVTLYDIPHDFTASITPGGPAVNVKTTIPGQNGVLTFSGTSGENVSLNLTNSTYPSCSPNVSIINPDGTMLFSNTCFGAGGFVPAQVLPSTGTYRILLTMTDPGTGSIAAHLYNVVNVTGTIVINGSAVNVSLPTPGQIAALTFAGTAGETGTVHVTNSTIACLTVAVIQPNGKTLSSVLNCGTSFNAHVPALPTTGSYSLALTPSQADTGSLTVALTSP